MPIVKVLYCLSLGTNDAYCNGLMIGIVGNDKLRLKKVCIHTNIIYLYSSNTA